MSRPFPYCLCIVLSLICIASGEDFKVFYAEHCLKFLMFFPVSLTFLELRLKIVILGKIDYSHGKVFVSIELLFL